VPSVQNRTDAELIELCNTAASPVATAAFASLYRRHRAYVLRVAARFAGDRDTALDALQETFTWLLRRFPPTGEGLTLTGKLTTLLYPVAKHCALDLRRQARRDTTGLDVPDRPAATAAAPDDLDVALASLSDDHREVLVLHYIEGWTLAEIAEALAIHLGTVKSRIHLAVKQLRDDPIARQFFAP
jgi:RNA polymerase sigma-70 factor, ECF subfamily